MTSEEHQEAITKSQEQLTDSDIAMVITRDDGEIESSISIDGDEHGEDYETLQELFLMLGSATKNVSEITVFGPEETAVLALEHFEAAENE